MRISSGNPNKAQAFINGQWTPWMDRNEAQKLEYQQNWGKNPQAIIPLAVALRLGIVPAGVTSASRDRH